MLLFYLKVYICQLFLILFLFTLLILDVGPGDSLIIISSMFAFALDHNVGLGGFPRDDESWDFPVIASGSATT